MNESSEHRELNYSDFTQAIESADSSLVGVWDEVQSYGLDKIATMGSYVTEVIEFGDKQKFPQIAALLKSMIPQLLQGEHFHTVADIYKFLGEDPMLLRDYCAKILPTATKDSQTLSWYALNLCDDEHVLNRALLNMTSDFVGSFKNSLYRRTYQEAAKEFREYASSKKIPVPCTILPNHFYTAVELHRENSYDAIIGIISGGTPVPLMIQAQGGKVGMMRIHKHWKRGPIWHQQCELKKGMKILVCEDDAVSGDTLSKVVEKLHAEAEPTAIDVYFSSEFTKKSVDVGRRIPKIREVLTAKNFQNDRVYSNILHMRKFLQTASVLRSAEALNFGKM